MNGRTILSIPKDILGEVDFKAGEAVMVVANSVKQEIVVRRADE
jgi:antitoxin component of MazEF toxin-antitoxin module